MSFAPLLDPALPREQLDAIMADLRSASFHPDRPDSFVFPSYDLLGEGFDERRYWRGPVWINTNWLLWQGLRQHGQAAEADEILLSSLRLVDRSGFHEYFDPFGGAAFGTDGFGWTAALTLDCHRTPPGHGPRPARGAVDRHLRSSIRGSPSADGSATSPGPKWAGTGAGASTVI